MADNSIDIIVKTSRGDVKFTIFRESSLSDSLIYREDAPANGEAENQLREGCVYEYSMTDGYGFKESEYVSVSKVNHHSGRISPNNYVGTLTIKVYEKNEDESCGEVKLEVQSVKTSYRDDYRQMLEEIAEKCTDLVLQHSSPVTQNIQTNYNADAATLYQRFAFIKSIIESEEFNDAIHKVISSPVTRWKESESEKDIRGIKKIGSKELRQVASASNRIRLPEQHPLYSTIQSLPSKLRVTTKEETVDTPENRFIKHALSSFFVFITDLKTRLNSPSRLKQEASILEAKLEQLLSHSIFKEIATPTTLPLNSPVLQRKEGYREIFRVWLLFDLAAKLTWKGGEDVYSAGKRDVAVLYEYWLFFKLLDLVKEVFDIDPASTESLFETTRDGIGLMLKQGKYFPIQGVYKGGKRKLHVEFSYNRTFKGGNEYPKGGSWSRDLRPDYTLSIWPFGIDANTAEKEELIVHIHFDAKYKIENLQTIFGNEGELINEEEKAGIVSGTYKRTDILKMHTYRDAIRRTAGAYVLYPGDKENVIQGFHEILPGLGAFPIRPSSTDNGTDALKKFLNDVVEHFLNRASQREKFAYKLYDTFKSSEINKVEEELPEPYGERRDLIPDETYVLVGYYKDETQLNWIVKNKLYNARTGTTSGSLRLSPKETGAKYLLLHSKAELIANRLFKLNSKGPRIFSKAEMEKKGYTNPSQEFYLVYDLLEFVEEEFEGKKWDIRKLEEHTNNRGSAFPFATTLTELMKAIEK